MNREYSGFTTRLGQGRGNETGSLEICRGQTSRRSAVRGSVELEETSQDF
ncbi:hypothetical protein F2Q70_00019899 [Brassica cretica]|uniref:Uncharacterized protein n=1 Tax=Brassica cretica TaxID=69181 RepID=A0A8S9GLG6_BRACR|nr:hypothetical protein F2Q70_00019899 [Brassica cretica]